MNHQLRDLFSVMLEVHYFSAVRKNVRVIIIKIVTLPFLFLLISSVSLASNVQDSTNLSAFKKMANTVIVPKPKLSALKNFYPFEYKNQLQLNKAIDITSKQLDLVFKEVISFYPKQYHATLEDHYYRKFIKVSGLREKEGCYGTTQIRPSYSDEKQPEILVRIDEAIIRTKLFYKLILLHEVGAHLGQMLALLEKSGPYKYNEYASQPLFHVVTELTAFNLQKLVASVMQDGLVQLDLIGTFGDTQATYEMFREYESMLRSADNNYAWIKLHRSYLNKDFPLLQDFHNMANYLANEMNLSGQTHLYAPDALNNEIKAMYSKYKVRGYDEKSLTNESISESIKKINQNLEDYKKKYPTRVPTSIENQKSKNN